MSRYFCGSRGLGSGSRQEGNECPLGHSCWPAVAWTRGGGVRVSAFLRRLLLLLLLAAGNRDQAENGQNEWMEVEVAPRNPSAKQRSTSPDGPRAERTRRRRQWLRGGTLRAVTQPRPDFGAAPESCPPRLRPPTFANGIGKNRCPSAPARAAKGVEWMGWWEGEREGGRVGVVCRRRRRRRGEGEGCLTRLDRNELLNSQGLCPPARACAGGCHWMAVTGPN